MVCNVIYLKSWAYMLFLQNTLLKRLMETIFSKRTFWAKQLFTKHPLRRLTWSQQLKYPQIALFLPKVVVNKSSQYQLKGKYRR